MKNEVAKTHLHDQKQSQRRSAIDRSVRWVSEKHSEEA